MNIETMTDLLTHIGNEAETAHEAVTRLYAQFVESRKRYNQTQDALVHEQMMLLNAVLVLLEKPHGYRWKDWGNVVLDQLQPDQRVHGKYDTQAEAEEAVQRVRQVGIMDYAEVRQLRISENDLPTNDPAYNPANSVENTYWCVVTNKIWREETEHNWEIEAHEATYVDPDSIGGQRYYQCDED